MGTSSNLALRRSHRLPAALAALVLGLGVLAGCGDGGPAHLTTDAQGPTALQISLLPPYPGADQPVRSGRWTLTCDPAGGTLPDPVAACEGLLRDPSVLEPPPCEGDRTTDRGTVTVTGTFRGQPVQFRREDGSFGECDRDQEAIGRLLRALGNPRP